MIEASRIESSLGPAKQDMTGCVWERAEKCVRTYSYDITITIVQALIVEVKFSSDTEICPPPLGCFGNRRPRIFCKRV